MLVDDLCNDQTMDISTKYLKRLIEKSLAGALEKYQSEDLDVISSYNWLSDRESKRYNEWREAILRRDDAMCALCGSYNRPIAHHIERWADNVNRRFDLKNGVTVCLTCHNTHHGEHGRPFPQEVNSRLLYYIKGLYGGAK